MTNLRLVDVLAYQDEQTQIEAEWTEANLTTLGHMVFETCEEDDVEEIPAEMVAVECLMAELTATLALLQEVWVAMSLTHDCGEPISNRQRDAAVKATDLAVDALREWGPVFRG